MEAEISPEFLGQRIWELREERGWSQRRMSKEAGITQVTASKIETGQVMPRSPTLRKLARVFDMTVDELLGMEGGADPFVPSPAPEDAKARVTAILKGRLSGAARTLREIAEIADPHERERYLIAALQTFATHTAVDLENADLADAQELEGAYRAIADAVAAAYSREAREAAEVRESA